MGLFSKKDPAAHKPPSKVRPSVSSEAQASELRVRARRRLAGAVALVMAAVVVLPMLLDSEPIPVSNNIAIRIPDRNAPFQPTLSDSAQNLTAPSPNSGVVQPTHAAGAKDLAAAATAAASNSNATSPALTAPALTAPNLTTPLSTSPPVTTKSDQNPQPKPESKQEIKAKAEAKPETKQESAKANVNRSDDGTRALALLEGRPTESQAANTNATNKQPTKGNFVVQAVSLDTAADAQAQRDKLSAAGVGNSFVDGPVVVNDLQKFRVRVGPFPSREAAQAAQTRLRTLGFGGAFIATQ